MLKVQGVDTFLGCCSHRESRSGSGDRLGLQVGHLPLFWVTGEAESLLSHVWGRLSEGAQGSLWLGTSKTSVFSPSCSGPLGACEAGLALSTLD